MGGLGGEDMDCRRVGLLLLMLCLAGTAQAGPYRAPRTPWGAPNLQGMWSNFALTRLERPKGVEGLTPKPGADIGAIERLIYDSILPADPLESRASEWWAKSQMGKIDGQFRTSWITSTPDGRIPYTPEGQRRLEAARAGAFADFSGPEARNTSERCMLTSFSANVAPMQNPPYSALYQIVQTKDAVVIVSEIDTDARIIRLNAAPAPWRNWGGQSVGHWEKDVLVVETRGFHAQEGFRAPMFYASPDARVTERFRRISAREIRYEFTVEDPVAYKEPWKGEMPFLASSEPMYEYACHEGNNSLPGILEGARYVEAHPEGKAAPGTK